jgi:hypothetical protein
VFAVPDDEAEAPDPAPRPKPKRAATREEPEDDLEGGEILDDEPEEEPEEDRPAKRKKKKKKPQKKGVPLWVWLTASGLGLLFLMCLGCGGVFWYVGSSMANVGSGNVTFFNYLKIQKGASEADVKAILGEPEQGFAQMMDDPI